MPASSIEETIRRLERTLVNEGDFKMRMTIFDRQPGEAKWPEDLPPLSAEAAAWFGTHFVSGEFLGAWRWAPWAAEVYRESLDVPDFRPSLVPVLDGEPVYYLDMQDGSVWSRDDDGDDREVSDDDGGDDSAGDREAQPPRFSPSRFASFTALLESLEADYAARAGSPWRALRVDRSPDPAAQWQPLSDVPDAAALAEAEVGAVLLARSLTGEQHGELWLKLDPARWARSSFYAPVPFDEEYLDDVLAKLRYHLADHNAALTEHRGDEAAAHLRERVATWRALGALELVRGQIRVWSRPDPDALVARFDVALNGVAPSLREALAAPASDEELAEFESYLGASLPPALRALWKLADGQRGAEPLYMGHRFLGVAEARQLIAAKRDEADQKFGEAYWQLGVMSFLARDNGELLCVDALGAYGPIGGITDFDPEWPERRQILFDSVTEWLECFVDGIEAGLYVLEPEQGLYPEGFLATGWHDEVTLLNEVRMNNRYPWERHLQMRRGSTERSM